jgi:serine/threonine-protein kinase
MFARAPLANAFARYAELLGRSGMGAPATPEAEERSQKRRKKRSKEPLLAVGSVLDKYRIDEVLGTGAFAVVYRATHLLLQSSVAIKMLLPSVVRRNARMAAMLCEEARIAARVDHENVVRVRDVHHDDHVTYIVMELVEGASLSRTIAKHGRIDGNGLARIGTDVCCGLVCALEKGIIHRDIKPSNILLTRTGLAKVIDLGLARYNEIDHELGTRTRSHFSPNAVVGTPTYMSPEQLHTPQEVDYRSDIYSLGVTLYHAAVGSPPFVARSVRDLDGLHSRVRVPAVHVLVPGFPRGLSELMARMMRLERSERPQTYADIVAELRRCAAAA